MKLTHLLLALPLILMFGCSSTDPSDSAVVDANNKPLTPFAAVVMANEIADTGVEGFASEFEFEILDATMVGEELYLNSHIDNQHPFALSVRVYPQTAKALLRQYGQDLPLTMMNKKIKVLGVPQRQKMSLNCDDAPSGKYYYQTHIKVLTMEQINLSD